MHNNTNWPHRNCGQTNSSSTKNMFIFHPKYGRQKRFLKHNISKVHKFKKSDILSLQQIFCKIPESLK